MAAQMPEKNSKQTIPGKTDPKRSDYITNKVLLVFSGCLLGVLGLMFLNNVLGYSVYWEIGLAAIGVMRIVGVVLAVIGVLLVLREKKRGFDMSYRVFKGSTLVVFGVALAIVFSIVDYNAVTGIHFLYVALPAYAFAYLIYHSYQPEFFIIATAQRQRGRLQHRRPRSARATRRFCSQACWCCTSCRSSALPRSRATSAASVWATSAAMCLTSRAMRT